jgi:phosphate uptake regulator
VLVEVTPELRAMARELYGSVDDAAQALASLSDEQLEFLIEFNRQSVAYQESLIRRLEEAKASRSP